MQREYKLYDGKMKKLEWLAADIVRSFDIVRCQHFVSQSHPCSHKSGEHGFLFGEGRGPSREAESAGTAQILEE